MLSEEFIVESSATPRCLSPSPSLPLSLLKNLMIHRWQVLESQEEPSLGLFVYDANTGKSICQVSSETSTLMCGNSLLGKFTTNLKQHHKKTYVMLGGIVEKGTEDK